MSPPSASSASRASSAPLVTAPVPDAVPVSAGGPASVLADTPVNGPLVPLRSAGTSARAVLRRAAKVLVCCLLGYGVLWAGSAGGMVALSAWARHDASGGRHTAAGIHHFLRVDAHVWRGSAPDPAGYRELADQGIRTVVDLRAEDLSAREMAQPAQAGLTSVRLPIRDGQTPTRRQVDRLIQVYGTPTAPSSCTAARASAGPAR